MYKYYLDLVVIEFTLTTWSSGGSGAKGRSSDHDKDVLIAILNHVSPPIQGWNMYGLCDRAQGEN